MIKKTKKMSVKDKLVKIISAFLIISFIVPSVLLSKPKRADAQWYTFSISDFFTGLSSTSNSTTAGSTVTNTGVSLKNVAKEILKQAAMAVAKRALQEATKSIVNWINGGFHGSPLFLENPESFFEDIAKSELKNLVDIYGYDRVKYPFGRDFALNAINAYKSTLEDNAAFTLSEVMTDPGDVKIYLEDFNAGGWNGFLINTQYPQNNYLGFQMQANEDLAIRIRNTSQAPAEKIQTLLQQGQGFLSPQTCPSNPKYNNGYNEFNQPRFNEVEWATRPENQLKIGATEADRQEWLKKREAAKAEWDEKNTCPGGLVNTTPGTVVADQIKINLGSSVRQKELAAAMGNSLSQIFDALINKFIGDGLNSLATAINPPPSTEDNWNYEGFILGSGEGGTNISWDSYPDILIGLDDFKKQLSGRTIVTIIDEDGTETTKEETGNTGNGTYIPGDIANTQKEIQLMDDLMYYFSQIWPETRKLDMCIPGPDMNWQDRLQAEVLRNSQKLQKLQAEDNAKKSEEANAALRELKFAADFFKDWINNKIITELPTSILFMEAVDDVKTLPQQATELIDAKRVKTQGLARMQAIKIALDSISSAPAGSAAEKTLISLKKQYDGANLSISNSITVNNRQNDVAVAKDKLNKLKTMLPQCEAERKTKGWGTPGGATSSYSGSTTTSTATAPINGLAVNSEQAIFCSLPIVGGYSHEKFLNQTGVTHPEIPMVNAKKILRYEITTIKSFLTSLPGNHTTAAYVNIQLSCNAIFNAKLLDYKGNLPGITTVREITDTLPDDSGVGETGTCTYSGVDANGAPLAPDTDMSKEDCDLNGGSWEKDSGGN